jgi:hypothetical protein
MVWSQPGPQSQDLKWPRATIVSHPPVFRGAIFSMGRRPGRTSCGVAAHQAPPPPHRLKGSGGQLWPKTNPKEQTTKTKMIISFQRLNCHYLHYLLTSIRSFSTLRWPTLAPGPLAGLPPTRRPPDPLALFWWSPTAQTFHGYGFGSGMGCAGSSQ